MSVPFTPIDPGPQPRIVLRMRPEIGLYADDWPEVDRRLRALQTFLKENKWLILDPNISIEAHVSADFKE